ncbi:MAG TPA: single-stranded DNA-binding protein [Phycisphaerae bacterium]|nr:single-stranded DNA-binding protein [Phycisphaerae bacterium]
MANFNKVLLMGNITRDPELKYMPNQTAVCDFGLAVNRTWTGQDGVKKEETTFVDCSCFGKTAEILSKYKKKGDPLFVEGRLKLDQWEAQDGTKRSKMRVVVENFQFLNRSGGQGAPGGGYAGQEGGEEYGGEPGGGGGYAARPQAARGPAAGGAGGYRQGGRPASGAPMGNAPRPAAGGGGPAGPNYDAGDAMPSDDAPPLTNDEIPF